MNSNSPIIIGGLGGSGTRVVAELLQRSGIYLGDILNPAKDNLLFSRLFKRPLWLQASNPQDIHQHIQTFEKYMCGQRWNMQDCHTYWQSTQKYVPGKRFRMKKIYALLLKQFFKRNSPPPKRWGWKEPNTHIFLPQLIDYFKELKYIYVVRHGLDMAFSQNKQQLLNWGQLFDIQADREEGNLILSQFDYWAAANERALEIGQSQLKDHFYWLNYDQLCLNKEEEIQKLFAFLNLELEEKMLPELLKIPKESPTMGRYKEHDLSTFSDQQLKKLEQLGFPLVMSE